MWILRQLANLVLRVAVAGLIVLVLSELVAVIRGGDAFHTFQIMCYLFGGLLLLLGAAGNGSAASRRVNWGQITPGRGGVMFRGFRPRPDEPQMTATAVFVATGILLIVLGAIA